MSKNLTATINPNSSTGDDANGALLVSDGSDTVTATDIANLTGGTGSNTLDYSNYYSSDGTGITVDLATGTASSFQSVQNFENVTGSSYDDSIAGDANANILIGGSGNDTFSGGGGQDTIEGGSGVNTLVENLDASMTLSNTALVVTPAGSTTPTTETLSGIDLADLTGGINSVTIDASAFTGLTTQTPLSFLNHGNGVNVSGGPLQIMLTNGDTVQVDLSHAVSVGDVLQAIDASSTYLTASLNTAATEFVLTDSSGGAGNLSVSSRLAGFGPGPDGRGQRRHAQWRKCARGSRRLERRHNLPPLVAPGRLQYNRRHLSELARAGEHHARLDPQQRRRRDGPEQRHA